MAAKSRTARFYATHKKSREKRQDYQSEFNKKPEQVKKRVELNSYNRKAIKEGRTKVGDNTDATHRYDKATGKMRIVGFSKENSNRGSKTASPGDRNSRNARYRPGGRKK